MDATPAEILSATLLAQLQVLKHGCLRLTPTTAPSPAWLHVRWDRNVVRDSIPDILAALHVLAQLSRASKRAWVQVLLQLWPTLETSAWKQRSMYQLDRTSMVGLLVECFQPSDLPDSLDRWLESKMDLSRDKETPAIPMYLYFHRVRGIPQMMMTIEDLVAPRGTLLPRPYRVTTMSFLGGMIDELALHTIAKVARRGVVIDQLPDMNAS